MRSKQANSKLSTKIAALDIVHYAIFLPIIAIAAISLPYLCQTYKSEQAALQTELDKVSAQIKQNTIVLQNMQVKLEAFKGEQITLQADALGLHRPAPQNVVQIDPYGRRRDNGIFANVQHQQHPASSLTEANQNRPSMKN